MRLLRLVDDDILDLHPRLSLVAGLTEAQRETLVSVIRQLGEGVRVGAQGLVEAQGVVLDLSPDISDTLDLPGGLDALLTGDELPGLPDGPAARRKRNLVDELEGARRTRAATAAAVDAAREHQARLTDEVARLKADAENADTRQAALAGELETAQHAVADLSSSLQQTEAQIASLEKLDREALQADAESQLEDARAALAEAEAAHGLAISQLRELQEADQSEDLGPQIDEARREVEQLEAAFEAALAEAQNASADPESETAPDDHAAELESQIAAAQARVDDLQRQLDEARRDSDPPTREYLDAVAEIERFLHADSDADDRQADLAVRATSLADELDAVLEEIAAHEAEGGQAELDEARAAVDEARQELLEIETSSRPQQRDPALVEQLEQVHADLLETQEKAESRFGGKKARQRVDALRADEIEILQKLGFSTYSDFMMSSSILSVDTASSLRVDRARRELIEAEERLAEAQARSNVLAQPPAELLNRQALLRGEASAMLGYPSPDRLPGDAPSLLRSLADSQSQSSSDDAVRSALAFVGADTAAAADDLRQAAQAWLDAEVEALDQKQSAIEMLEQELQAAKADYELLDRERFSASMVATTRASGVPNDASVDQAAIALSDARDALAELEARRLTSASSEGEIAAAAARAEQLHDELDAAARRVQDLQAAMAEFDIGRHNNELRDLQKQRVEIVEALKVATARRDEVAAQRDAVAAIDKDGRSISEVEGALVEARAAAEQAAAAASAADSALVALQEELTALESQLAAERVTSGGVAAEVDEIEFYVLARIAALRSASFAGSVPLLVDNAFAALSAEDEMRVLRRLERMADSVQVIYLTDRPEIAAAIEAMTVDRAAVVQFEPAAASAPAPAG